MLEKILPGIYRVKIPLRNNPLKYTNSYIIPGTHRNLVIDTGLNNKECKEVMLSALRELGINISSTDFFLTHMHADHTGLVSEISTDTSRVFISKEDSPFVTCELNWETFWKCSAEFAMLHGFPKKLVKQAILQHPGYLYSPKKKPRGSIMTISDGDIICAGDFKLTCLNTPGHTMGHTCLYDAEHKILFSGDHILQDITPNISAAYENKNPLGKYLNSLRKIENIEVNITMPGHRSIIVNLKKRLEELENHHSNRLKEISDILKEKPQHAYDVASKMSWDINFSRWEDFPIAQKWFAHSEAVAHLLYLEEVGVVTSHLEKGVYYFNYV